MLHGDISNHVKATFGFMCEDFVIKFKDTGFTNKVLNTIIGRTKRAEVNTLVTKSMEYIYRQTEYNVDLIIEEKNYTADMKSIIEDLPFCRIVLYNKISQISSRLLTGDLTYVIDDDDYRRGLINSRNALTFKDFQSILKSGGRST
jgi:uncharacterized protein (UPF0297 family)